MDDHKWLGLLAGHLPIFRTDYVESPAELMFNAQEKIMNDPKTLSRIDVLLEEIIEGESKNPASLLLLEPIHRKTSFQVQYAELRLWVRTDSVSGELYGEITFSSAEGEQALAAIEL